MNKLKYFKDLVLEKSEQYQNEEMYGQTIEETIAYEIRDKEYEEINELISERIDKTIDLYINEMERKSMSLIDELIHNIIDDEGNREWLRNKILDNLEACEELQDILEEIKYLSKPENIKKIIEDN